MIQLMLDYTPKQLAEKVFQLAHFLDQMTILQKQSRQTINELNRENATLKTELALLKMLKGPSNEAPK